jgi:hypothetical protein
MSVRACGRVSREMHKRTRRTASLGLLPAIRRFINLRLLAGAAPDRPRLSRVNARPPLGCGTFAIARVRGGKIVYSYAEIVTAQADEQHLGSCVYTARCPEGQYLVHGQALCLQWIPISRAHFEATAAAGWPSSAAFFNLARAGAVSEPF